MNAAFIDALASHGATLITHIALHNAVGAEVGDARLAVTWTAPAGNGLIRPTADLVFNMTAGEVVAEWRGWTALTGGTDYGGEVLTQVTFGNDGTYTLQAASTAIDLNNV